MALENDVTASQSGVFSLQEFTDLGDPLVGGRLYTYVFGTTTHKTAYTDKAGTIPHTYTNDGLGGQYIALNARGELPAPLYLTEGSYDIRLCRADGSLVWTRRADPMEDLAASILADLADASDPNKGARLVAWARDATGAVPKWVSDVLGYESVRPQDFEECGTGVADSTPAFQKLSAWCDGKAMIDIEIPPGIYYVSDTVSFTRLWFFTIRAKGAIILPLTTATWTEKPVVEVAACFMGEVYGLCVPTNIFDAAHWQGLAKADRPTAALMTRREPVGGGWTIGGLGIAGGDGCQSVKFYNSYLFGWFDKAALVQTRSETIYFEGFVIGGCGCSAIIDTAKPSQVYQSDSVANSNRDKKYHFGEVRIENYDATLGYAAIEFYDAALDVSFRNTYFAFGGMGVTSGIAAGIKLTQNSGVGGFTNITLEDCYGENAGDKFALLDILSYDTHDVRIVGWRHSQEAGSTDSIVRYRGAQADPTLDLHLERVYPPTNTTPLVNIDQDIASVTIKKSRGLLKAASGKFMYNAELRMWADDIYASAPSGSYTAAALLPGAYTLVMDKYPTVAGFQRNRPIAIGTTTLTQTSAPNSLLYFNRAESDVFDITVTAGVNSTIEGPGSFRAYEDIGIDNDLVGDFEKCVLSFSNSTTLKHNYTVNSAIKFVLKAGADTTYAGGKAVQFMRNGNTLVEL